MYKVNINKNHLDIGILLIIALFSEGLMGYYIILLIVAGYIIINIIFPPHRMLLFLKNAVKNTKSVRYLLLFTITLFISFIFNILSGRICLVNFLIGGFCGYILHFICSLIIGMYIAYKSNSKTLVKSLILLLIIIIYSGLIEFILYKFSLPYFGFINSLCSSKDAYMRYKWANFPRIQSFFAEPSHYGWFLCCNIPIAFQLKNYKDKIFKNKHIDIIVKNSLFPLLLLSLVFTQSIINLIFGIIITIIYKLLISKKSFKTILNFFITILILAIIIVLILNQVDIEHTFLVRAINSIPSLFDINKLMVIEPSLSTRLLSYANMFLIFISNPLFGICPGNLKLYFIKQLAITKTPLTPELYKLLSLTNTPQGINPSIFFKVIAETGILGIFFLILLLFSFYLTCSKLINIISNDIKAYFIGLKGVLVVYCCLMFYDSNLYNHYFWILFGTIVGTYLKQKALFKHKIIQGEQNA